MLDVHSHILPGLDDGTKTPEESLEAIRGLIELGFTDLVCTPHFYPERYTPSLLSIDLALNQMKALVQEEGLSVNLIRGRECFLDSTLLTHEERDTFSFEWKESRFQLIELPSITVPQALSSYAQQLQMNSTSPILAHPERYNSIIKEPKLAEEYREMGFRIQIDLANLSSFAHPTIRKTTIALFELNYVDLVASDLHRPSQLGLIREGLEFVQKNFGEEALRQYASLP